MASQEGPVMDADHRSIPEFRDDLDWQGWVEFFSRTREADGRRKGHVEIER